MKDRVESRGESWISVGGCMMGIGVVAVVVVAVVGVAAVADLMMTTVIAWEEIVN